MCLKCLLIVFIFSYTQFAQDYSKSSANVNAKLVDGIVFNMKKGNLDIHSLTEFGDPNPMALERILLQVGVKQNSNIMINFSDAAINKVYPQERIMSNKNYKNDFLIFKPKIQTLKKSNDANLSTVHNNSNFIINPNVSRTALDFWISGTLSAQDNLKRGSYSGSFIISLIYN